MALEATFLHGGVEGVQLSLALIVVLHRLKGCKMLPGTWILTPSGFVKAESLSVGDMVVSHYGGKTSISSITSAPCSGRLVTMLLTDGTQYSVLTSSERIYCSEKFTHGVVFCWLLPEEVSRHNMIARLAPFSPTNYVLQALPVVDITSTPYNGGVLSIITTERSYATDWYIAQPTEYQ